MARSRNIKPGFFANEDLAECEPLARILFAGLWCMADRDGRLEDRPKRIRAEILRYDMCDAEPLLEQLRARGFIDRYEHEGVRYIQVIKFGAHQNPHKKEAKSTIPAPAWFDATPAVSDAGTEEAPDEPGASPVQAPEKHPKSPADSLIPDSLIPDSGFLEEKPAQAVLAPIPPAPPTKPVPAKPAKRQPKEGSNPQQVADAALAMPLPAGLDREDWSRWVAYRLKRKKVDVTMEAVAVWLRELGKIVAAGQSVKDAIDRSIGGGWTGLFIRDGPQRGAVVVNAAGRTLNRQEQLEAENQRVALEWARGQ